MKLAYRVEYLPDHEVCPWCGGFFPRLVEWSGWCDGCTAMFVGAPGREFQRCSSCGGLKPLDQFHRQGGKQGDVLRTVCRSCETARRRAWREAHIDQEREYDRERHRRTRGKVRQ